MSVMMVVDVEKIGDECWYLLWLLRVVGIVDDYWWVVLIMVYDGVGVWCKNCVMMIFEDC